MILSNKKQTVEEVSIVSAISFSSPRYYTAQSHFKHDCLYVTSKKIPAKYNISQGSLCWYNIFFLLHYIVDICQPFSAVFFCHRISDVFFNHRPILR